MPDILRLTFDFPLPNADLFERARITINIGAPSKVFEETLEAEGVKFTSSHEIIPEHAVAPTPKKRGRKPRVVVVPQAA